MIEEAWERIRKYLENQDTTLDLRKCGIRDLVREIPDLSEFLHLKALKLNINQISDASPLDNLSNLTLLRLDDNHISDASPLASLSNLTILRLGSNRISDVRPLTNLNNLTELSLDNNQVSDVNPLANLSNLTLLWLENNHISDASSLANLSNLTELSLDNNQISDARPLANLINLTELSLGSNRISDVRSLTDLNNLKKLSLDNNQVSDISPLANLSNLMELSMKNNQISNFEPLLSNYAFRSGRIKLLEVDGNPNPILNEIIKQGYEATKKYYDNLEVEGQIQNDQLKVILLGNSTAGKTSLAKYWGRKEFSDPQITTHGIAKPLELPLNFENTDETFRVNVWDFGGKDYYHATHRLFVTRDSTYVLVCSKELENKPGWELTTEHIQVGEEIIAVQIPVVHYPYRFWLQTLAFLTKAGKIDDPRNRGQDKSQLPKLFLVENKCADYDGEKRMDLSEGLADTLPFEIISGNYIFSHLDIKQAWLHTTGQDSSKKARRFSDDYDNFEEMLLKTLQAQISKNSYYVHKNYPIIRDLLALMADYQQNSEVSAELNQFLIEKKIAPIEQYEKLPVWMTYDQYQDLVRKNSQSAEPDFNSLHIYLQNLCGRILHFRDIPALADIVFIDPTWLHQTIYRVLSQDVLDKKGEFTIHEADAVIDGNIIEASQFMDVMKEFKLVFEIPYQITRRFVAPQYLPVECPLSAPQLKKNKEQIHQLALTLRFPHYLPPSLISRIISLKGHLIKAQDEPLWRNGLIYTESGLSTFLLCTPEQRQIEIYLADADQPTQTHRIILRNFMAFMEVQFSDEIEEVVLSLPHIPDTATWKNLYRAKKEGLLKAENSVRPQEMFISESFNFLFEEFKRKPVNVFVCYAHDDHAEMVRFVEPLKKELASFQAQDKGTIKMSPFTDLELTPGMRWDEVLKAKIKENDILICLLSPSFFGSTYIHENEYGQKMREIAAGQSNSLIAPVYLKSCYVSAGNSIGSLQFFKPLTSDFHLENTPDFSFSNLISHAGGSYVGNYVTAFVRSIAGNIEEIWGREEVDRRLNITN